MYKQNINQNSIGPVGLAWVVVFALKLAAVIHWSWWIVVFFPLLVIGAFLLGAVGIAAVLAAPVTLWGMCKESDKNLAKRKAAH